MNSIRKQKIEQVKIVSEKLKRTNSLVVFGYHGLSVAAMQELRQLLSESNVELKVYKNRLVKLATKVVGYEKLNEYLVGPNAYAFGFEDDIAPAKIIAKFAKEHNSLKIIAGTYENNVITDSEIQKIAILPSYEEALTILAGSMLAPLRYIAVGFNMIKDLDLTQTEKTPSNEIQKNNEKKEIN